MQQMDQQKKLMTIGAVIVIIACVAFLIWFYYPKGEGGITQPESPSPTTATQANPPTTTPTTSAEPTPAPQTTTPPPVVSQSSVPTATTLATGGQPTTPAPSALLTKSDQPQIPGRGDPFSVLPSPSASPKTAPTSVNFPLLPMSPTPTLSEQQGVLGEMLYTQTVTSMPGRAVSSVNFSHFRSIGRIGQPEKSIEDPSLRVAGVMVSDRTSAILELPDQRSTVVKPGSSVDINGLSYIVTRIELDKVVLRGIDGGERIALRRPSSRVYQTQLSQPSFSGPVVGPGALGAGAAGGIGGKGEGGGAY